jgi:hypothetical protein
MSISQVVGQVAILWESSPPVREKPHPSPPMGQGAGGALLTGLTR